MVESETNVTHVTGKPYAGIQSSDTCHKSGVPHDLEIEENNDMTTLYRATCLPTQCHEAHMPITGRDLLRGFTASALPLATPKEG